MSRQIFDDITTQKKDLLGNNTIVALETLMKKLDDEQKHLYHHFFMGKSTLGFKGDSIVEASFSSTKASGKIVSTKKTIDKSAMNMINHTMEKNFFTECDQAKLLCKEICWSSTDARKFLTKYALGLFCKNYDRRKEYFTRRINMFEWLSMREDDFEIKNDENFTPEFLHCRKITIDDDGYMNCSCGKTNEYLLPCVHICSVINDDEKFTPDCFHIRWHKQFAYHYGTESIFQGNEEQRLLLKGVLTDTRSNSYHTDGFYRGIDLKNNDFLRDLETYHFEDDRSDKIDFMKFVHEQSKKKPFLKNSVGVNDFRMYEFVATEETNLTNDTFSLFTQELYEDNTTLTSEVNKKNQRLNESSAYHQTYSAYEAALSMSNNQETIEKLRLLLVKFVHNEIAISGKHTQSKGDTVLYGENLMKANRTAKRHKFLYETF